MAVGGEELMLQNGRPFIILRLAAEAVDAVLVENHDAARRRELAGLIITAVAAGETAPVHPVGAVEPRAVEEAGGTEKMCGIAALLAALPGEVAGVRPEVDALTFAVKLLRLHVNEFLVAR